MFSFAKHSKHSSWLGRSLQDVSCGSAVGLDAGSEVGSEVASAVLFDELSFSVVPHARNKVLTKMVRRMVLSPLMV